MVQGVGTVSVREGAVLTNTQRFEIRLSSWTTEWAAEIDRYTQWKFANIQFVIEPRSVATGASNIRVATNEIPYLVVRSVVPSQPAVFTRSIQKLRQTPGCRYIPLLRKARVVHNINPTYNQVDTIDHPNGSTSMTTLRSSRMPWMEIDSALSDVPFGAIEITKPTLDSINGDGLNYDIRVYASIYLRGNKDELAAPYT